MLGPGLARSSPTSRSATPCRGRTRRPRMREFILAMRAIWASWDDGSKLDVPGRVLHPHPDDAVLQPGPEPLRQPQGLPGRRGRAHDRGGGRGRPTGCWPRLHHRALPARGHPARPRAGAGQRAGPGPTCRSRTRPSWSPATTEEDMARPPPAVKAPDRLLRLDARLPAGARAPRLGRPPARAQHPVQAGRVGGDGRAHRRRDARRLRRGRPRSRVPARCSPASATWSTGSASTRRTAWTPTRGAGARGFSDGLSRTAAVPDAGGPVRRRR